MSGRKRDPIWNYFEETNKENPTNKKAVCKVCGKTLQAMVSRMQKHKISCKNIPEETNKIQYIQSISGSSEESEAEVEDEMPLAAISAAMKRKISHSSQTGSTRGELFKKKTF